MLGLHCATQAPFVVESGSRARGLCSCGNADSRTGSLVVVHKLSCPVACGIFFPLSGIEPISLALEGGILSPGPLRKFPNLSILNTVTWFKKKTCQGRINQNPVPSLLECRVLLSLFISEREVLSLWSLTVCVMTSRLLMEQEGGHPGRALPLPPASFSPWRAVSTDSPRRHLRVPCPLRSG